MYADALLLEMLSDTDIAFALQAAGSPHGPRLEAAVRSIRQDPTILTGLLDDPSIYPALRVDPQNLVRVTPYFLFSIILRQARRELHARTFTAEWLSPRRRLPVFDAKRVAAVLEDEARLHYLADLLASFTARRGTDKPAMDGPGLARDRRHDDADLDALRHLRARATEVDAFTVDRRMGDVALFLAGVFPDSAGGALQLAAWEAESEARYRDAARAPLARQCGLDQVLGRLAADVRPSRKALNFVADRFLYPLHTNWFPVGA